MRAYTFELGKCYEQAVKERQLLALANIDPVLCREVAAGLGLPAPEATVDLADEEPSPALSQVGGTWPVDGRTVGVVVDADGDLSALAPLRRSLLGAGLLPLVVAARGGVLEDGTAVQRTFLTSRSVEFDAVVLLCAPAPAPDALPARDAKAGAAAAPEVDPRVALMVEEAYRHAKALAALDGGAAVLDLVGADASTPGVVLGDDPEALAEGLLAEMGAHRAWERFPSRIGA